MHFYKCNNISISLENFKVTVLEHEKVQIMQKQQHIVWKTTIKNDFIFLKINIIVVLIQNLFVNYV